MPETRPLIILVHGLGLKKGEIDESTKWTNALLRNLETEPLFKAAEIRMAYYSPELHPEVHVAAPTPGGQRRAEGDAGSAGTPELEDSVLDAIADLYLMDRRQPLAARAAENAARGARGDTLVPLPELDLQPDDEYRAFVRDVLKYFALGHRLSVNAKLTEALKGSAGRPVLLLTHSLGTVVTYDVLSAGNDYRIDSWVTMGSPLGYVQDIQRRLPELITHLKPEYVVKVAELGAKGEAAIAWASDAIGNVKEKLGHLVPFGRRGTVDTEPTMYALPAPAFPDAKVERWYNIFDPHDPVAAPRFVGDPTLSDEYLSDGRPRVYDLSI